MCTLEEMTVEIRSLFSNPAVATAVSDEATAFGVSDDTLNRALAWAWAVCGEVTEVSANRSQLTQLLPRIALFTDVFKDILTSTPVTIRRAGVAASAGGRSAAARGAAAEAATAAAAAPRDYATPPSVGNLLDGYEIVNGEKGGGGASDGEGQTGPSGGQTGGDDDGQREHATGGPEPGAVAPPAPQSPGRNEHVRPRIAQTPDGYTNLRHMPTLQAALGREHLSFNDVASLTISPPGHATNVPQRQADSLSLALAAEALASRLLRQDDIRIARSLRSADRLRGLADMMRTANDAQELHDQQQREA